MHTGVSPGKQSTTLPRLTGLVALMAMPHHTLADKSNRPTKIALEHMQPGVVNTIRRGPVNTVVTITTSRHGTVNTTVDISDVFTVGLADQATTTFGSRP